MRMLDPVTTSPEDHPPCIAHHDPVEVRFERQPSGQIYVYGCNPDSAVRLMRTLRREWAEGRAKYRCDGWEDPSAGPRVTWFTLNRERLAWLLVRESPYWEG
jgi:hypothetical protein